MTLLLASALVGCTRMVEAPTVEPQTRVYSVVMKDGEILDFTGRTATWTGEHLEATWLERSNRVTQRIPGDDIASFRFREFDARMTAISVGLNAAFILLLLWKLGSDPGFPAG